MAELQEHFEIEISQDKMEARINQKNELNDEIDLEELKQFIQSSGVVFGVDEDVVEQIAAKRVRLPVKIAEGIKPIPGEDAYLKALITIEKKKNRHDLDDNRSKEVNFREVMVIPTVTTGEVIGVKIDKTEEKNGMNVLGKEIKAKPGRDLKLRPGKNTRISDDGKEVIATTDGQVAMESKVIHVYPVYEVNGDLDMQTGNIDFIGNVEIRGGVPSGYRIKAKGDIRIHGSVESAELEAAGSIFIHQGVVAQGKGMIKAGGDFHTSFINQGNVETGGSVFVHKSILHSQITAMGHIICKQGRGNIVGGNVSSSMGIEVNEIGNTMNSPTSLYLGISQKIIEEEKKYKSELTQMESELEKLKILLVKMLEKEKTASLEAKERVLKLRIRQSIQETENRLGELRDKLSDINDIFENQEEAKIQIYNAVHPNTDIYFGKYRRKIVTKYENVQFRLDRSEIVFEPIV
ncbi:hypothetical protein SAMN05421736_103102 [Evansella caseinilytica]|uniref:Flagellar Assembly Protein A N-terminal region domain-containing protein n=1 Tax=Evansella caseinilytica TaxID=1503961 RepID=A0A1H3M4H5_9BACI|nr:FapA family protein [Evansella caseinilytica]SDY71119.1 hypothetical protein SAMN05421736_103102 [Evansella caseinilytica]